MMSADTCFLFPSLIVVEWAHGIVDLVKIPLHYSPKLVMRESYFATSIGSNTP